jgi:O-antigen/teichoic acid export membrane protein
VRSSRSLHDRASIHELVALSDIQSSRSRTRLQLNGTGDVVMRLRETLARAHSPYRRGDITGSRKRYRTTLIGAGAGVAGRAISLITVVASIPLVLGALGPHQFGIWATLVSFVILLNFADLGIANGLVNLLVATEVEDARDSAGEHVTSALVLLAGVAGLLAVSFAGIYPAVDWVSVYNTGTSVRPEAAAQATAVFVWGFLLLLPLGLCQRVHLGYQEAHIAQVWTSAGSLVALAGIGVAASVDASLTWFVAASVGGPLIGAALNALYLAWAKPWLRPRASRVRAASVRALTSSGTSFFVIQASSAVAYFSGPLIVAQVAGAASVEDYAVPMRLFGFLPILLSIALTAAWPTLRSAVLEGDIRWARTALKRAMGLGVLILAPPTIGLVCFGDPLLRLWTDGRVGASTTVAVAFGAWAILSAFVWPLWIILHAAGALSVQAAMSSLMAVAAVALSVILTDRIGVAGVVVGLSVAQLVLFVLPASLYVSRLLDRLERA